MKELGVGLVYVQGFENFLASHSSLVDVVEIEPQSFWYDKNDECNAFKYDPEITNFLWALEQPKLFHCVGFPIGGTFSPPQEQFNTLKQQAKELSPEWISEHLSFNFFNDGNKAVNAGFLLPPIQSTESIKIAAANIRNYQSQMNLPFAFETGVNYLQPRKNEMPDGLFVRSVAEEADCHILLDLHNILTNQRNGRQSVKEFLDLIPYERVIELHVGGGMYYKNYYLDAHSGASDTELLSILESVVKKLPNLKALIFEMAPDYLIKIPEREIRDQLIKMHRIWDKRGNEYKKKDTRQKKHNYDESIPVNEWETTIGKLILGKNPENTLSKKLQKDKGIAIIKDLVFNFRGSMLISLLKLSTRLLRLTIGELAFNHYINDFFYSFTPELLPVILAEQFLAYIKAKKITDKIRYLEEILEYELAAIHNAIDKQGRSVLFDFDPVPVLAALNNTQLPSAQLNRELHIINIPASANELPEFVPVVHN